VTSYFLPAHSRIILIPGLKRFRASECTRTQAISRPRLTEGDGWFHWNGRHRQVLASSPPRRGASAQLVAACPGDCRKHFSERDQDAVCKAASPRSQVHAGAPPFYVGHGTADVVVPYAQAQEFVTTLRSAKVEVHFFLADGGPHTYWMRNRFFAENLAEIKGFFAKNLAAKQLGLRRAVPLNLGSPSIHGELNAIDEAGIGRCEKQCSCCDFCSVPTVPRGTIEAYMAAVSVPKDRSRGVSIGPGLRTFTRIPLSWRSTSQLRAKARSAALLPAERLPPIDSATEPFRMIEPPSTKRGMLSEQ